MGKTRAVRLPDILTEEEREGLLRQPNPRTPTGLRNLCMIRLMLNAGLRSSEVLNLIVGDINWITGTFKVREGKGKKDRVLYVGEDDRASFGCEPGGRRFANTTGAAGDDHMLAFESSHPVPSWCEGVFPRRAAGLMGIIASDEICFCNS